MTQPSEHYIIPDLDDVPVDDDAEAPDAEVEHLASVQDVEEQA